MAAVPRGPKFRAAALSKMRDLIKLYFTIFIFMILGKALLHRIMIFSLL